ncbi:MAG: hypothetical protein ABJF11_06780 [Reichenbachiella sp.]|uniref:hypothetical protein n=1 Tax=Reichenbachiella sp. TaxID=2184521 RepID=UPI0032630FBF
MLFGKPKPTVTSEDQEWIEDAFIWLEEQYGREYLKSLKIIEPTKEFFDHQFTGTEADAEYALKKLTEYMDLKGTNIELYYFSESPMEFEDEGIVATQNSNGTGTQDNYALGTYSEDGPNKFEIGLDLSQLKDPQSMIATLAHELSHMVLLGEGRLEENDEELTDLNCIALGLGIFISNSIFNFQQWQGSSHQGWQANRQGYIPEEVAAYALALFNNYQNNQSDWHQHLNKSMTKLYKKNLKYLQSTTDELRFK